MYKKKKIQPLKLPAPSTGRKCHYRHQFANNLFKSHLTPVGPSKHLIGSGKLLLKHTPGFPAGRITPDERLHHVKKRKCRQMSHECNEKVFFSLSLTGQLALQVRADADSREKANHQGH